MSEHQKPLLPLHLRNPLPASKPQLRAVSLTDSAIRSFTYHPQLRAEFPFVRAVQKTPQRRSCSRCGKSVSRFDTEAVDVNRLKENLKNLSADDLARFKHLIGASELTIFMPSSSGPRKIVL